MPNAYIEVICEVVNRIQFGKVQKPQTGQKTGPRTIRKILLPNEPVYQKKFTCIKIFSIGSSEVRKPETG